MQRYVLDGMRGKLLTTAGRRKSFTEVLLRVSETLTAADEVNPFVVSFMHGLDFCELVSLLIVYKHVLGSENIYRYVVHPTGSYAHTCVYFVISLRSVDRPLGFTPPFLDFPIT